MLDILPTVQCNDVINRRKYFPHYPTSPTYRHGDQIRFHVGENSIGYVLPSQSYIIVEGYISKNPATSDVRFVENFGAYLFSECRYSLNTCEIDCTREVGDTTTLKGLCSFTPDERKMMEVAGWGDRSKNQATVKGGHFSLSIPLKTLLGFAEDFDRIIVSARHDLIFTRANHDKDALISTTKDVAYEVDASSTEDGADNTKAVVAKFEASEIRITKMVWYLPSVSLSFRAHMEVQSLIDNQIPLPIAFRTWAYFKEPAVPSARGFTWSVTTLSSIERPRFIIIAFQTDRTNSYEARKDYFDHVKVNELQVYLNNEVFPTRPMTMDFDQDNYVQPYQMYADFQNSFYKQKYSTPCVDYKDFATNHAIYVVDCVDQDTDNVKPGQIRIRIDAKTSEAIPANTCCHCIVIHDKNIEYTPVTNIVRQFQ